MAQNLDRDELYKFVRRKDPNGHISKNLIGWEGSSQYEATGYSWNGYGFECYLCDREFTTLNGLNQHLNSSVRKCKLLVRDKSRHVNRTELIPMLT